MRITPLHFLISVSLSFLSFNMATAQIATGNYVKGFEKNGNAVFFSNEHADVRLEFCSPKTVRIRTSWNRTFKDNEPWMVVKYQWPAVAVNAKEEGDHFTLSTSDLVITIKKKPFGIQVADRQNKILTSEIPAGSQGGAWKDGDAVSCVKAMQADEHFFGFGERMDFLDRRSKELRLNVGRGTGMPHIIGAYNVLEANYCPIPFFMSTQGYGIFFHNAYPTTWDMGSNNPDHYSFKADGGELDYYLMYGPDFPAILDQYTTLTGKAPLLPLFALGLQVGTYSGGTWGYEKLTSAHYVIELVKKFRELGIPIDVLHLDSTWRIFGENGGKGATSFEWRETFTDPKSMFDSLYAMHINMVGVHLRPRFDNGKKLRLLDEARKGGYVFPEKNNSGEFVNFFDSASVQWWWDHGVMNVASIGARFLKTDEGSAFGHLANESSKTGPTGDSIKELHNLFPIAYAKAPYEKFQAFNHMRGMNHTREGYAGIQRYPFIFAGDWPSEWQYFEPVMKAGLNISLSGVGNWAHCMGGFEHPADPELYIRWCQFGMFSPVAHLFGMDHPGYKEPWNYGDEALRIFTQYDKLRYRLIPYIYSHSYEMFKTGMPIMRPLVLVYQHDENVYNITDQYLFGSSIMVCPVTTKGAQTRTVYFPEGKWTDYWSGKEYDGKKYYNVVSPLDQLPLFIKAGAIIPMQEEVQYTENKSWSLITLDIYPAGKSSFSLYEDDGLTLEYLKGNFAQTTFSCDDTAEKLTLTLSPSKGLFKVPARNYRMKVHLKKAPENIVLVSAKGQVLKSVAGKDALAENMWYYDKEAGVVWIACGKAAGKETVIEIVK